MKNLKKVLTVVVMTGVLVLGLIGISKGTDAFASKDAWGYMPPVVDTI